MACLACTTMQCLHQVQGTLVQLLPTGPGVLWCVTIHSAAIHKCGFQCLTALCCLQQHQQQASAACMCAVQGVAAVTFNDGIGTRQQETSELMHHHFTICPGYKLQGCEYKLRQM